MKKLKIKYDLSKPTIPTYLSVNCGMAKKKFGWKQKIKLDDDFENAHNQCNHFTGGTLYSTAFGASPLETDDKPMREILCTNENTIDFHLVAAMLNAHHYSSYILTVAQVKGLRDGSVAYPSHYDALNDFLDDTWTDI